MINEQNLYYVGDLFQVMMMGAVDSTNPEAGKRVILSGEYGLFYGVFTFDFKFEITATEKYFNGSSVTQINFMELNSSP